VQPALGFARRACACACSRAALTPARRAVGDTVLLKPPDARILPYVGRCAPPRARAAAVTKRFIEPALTPVASASRRPRSIEAFAHATGGPTAQVAWFYRPEEAVGGRKAFHSARELFGSDHLDWVGASSIEGRCRVLDLRSFQALQQPGDADFFARFHYRAAAQKFAPSRVPVFCRCEMPYNPDLAMLECIACAEWYHPECLGMGAAEVGAAQRGFVCPDCSRAHLLHRAAPPAEAAGPGWALDQAAGA